MPPVEVQAAQLAAARTMLDASKVRVLDALHVDRDGALAILAAPTLDSTPAITCLAAVLRGDAPVRCECPIYGRHGLVQTLSLDVPAGQQRVVQ